MLQLPGQCEAIEASESETPAQADGDGAVDQSSSGSSRTPAPFMPDDPYSPESTSKRQSDNRREAGSSNSDPDSAMPDRAAGEDMGGHTARGRTPHKTGERNVNSAEEHSRRPKGNPSGRAK